MIVVGWPLTFLRQSQICTLIHLYGKNVEKKKSFSQYVLKTNGLNLQCMIKEVNFLDTIKIWGYLPLPLGYTHV